MGVINFLASLFSVVLLKWFGRKTLIVSGQGMIAIDMILLGIFSGYEEIGVVLPAIFAMLFFVFYSFSLGATLWMYVGEVLNDQILSVSCVMNILTTVIITFLFPPATDWVGIDNCFFFFGVSMIIGMIYSAFDLIETKNKQKEEILIEMNVIESAITKMSITENFPLPTNHVENDSETDPNPQKIISTNNNKSNNLSI